MNERASSKRRKSSRSSCSEDAGDTPAETGKKLVEWISQEYCRRTANDRAHAAQAFAIAAAID
jgi:hypothetical protein